MGRDRESLQALVSVLEARGHRKEPAGARERGDGGMGAVAKA